MFEYRGSSTHPIAKAANAFVPVLLTFVILAVVSSCVVRNGQRHRAWDAYRSRNCILIEQNDRSALIFPKHSSYETLLCGDTTYHTGRGLPPEGWQP